ncbi:unnamed protein product [Lasius platythorax]|uniref:Uncharacterized protein n=1 Tax=Lasius platythorax TaxID=488582 RepID=A0AAV2N290_9HYME
MFIIERADTKGPFNDVQRSSLGTVPTRPPPVLAQPQYGLWQMQCDARAGLECISIKLATSLLRGTR